MSNHPHEPEPQLGPQAEPQVGPQPGSQPDLPPEPPINLVPPDATPPTPPDAASSTPPPLSVEPLPPGAIAPSPPPLQPGAVQPPPLSPQRKGASAGVIALVIVGAVFFFGAGFAVGVGIEDEGGEEGSPSAQETAQGTAEGASDSTPLKEARAACAPSSGYLRLGDGDYTLIVDRAGAEEDPGASYADVMCVLDEIGTPDYVISHIESTRALDGTQEASFGEYSMFWTYHPDNGLNMTITWNP